MGVANHVLHIDAGEAWNRYSIGNEARDDRRIHDIGRTPIAEQIVSYAAEARARLGPKLENPVDLFAHRFGELFWRKAFAHVHREFATQIGKARVHFSSH